MITIKERFFLFLVICIGSRLLLVYIAKNISNELLEYMGYLLLLPAISFIYIYLSGTRNTGTGAFGQEIWWNNLRPIHGLLYLLFSYNAIIGNKDAWIYLFIDALFGLTSFLIYHLFLRQ
jgi:hypothetical protein